MKGTLYLSGGGSAEQTFEADKEIFKNINSILYIPLAWDSDETYEGCREWFESMITLHPSIKSYHMIKSPEENIDFNNFDLVYIGGGNTFKLLKNLKETNLSQKLIKFLEKGGKIYGGSAGAIIWGEDIEICTIGRVSDENKVKLENTSGFSKIGGRDIQCHYSQDEAVIHQKYSKLKNREIIAISEENVIVLEQNNLKVLGEKEVFLINAEEIKKL